MVHAGHDIDFISHMQYEAKREMLFMDRNMSKKGINFLLLFLVFSICMNIVQILV